MQLLGKVEGTGGRLYGMMKLYLILARMVESGLYVGWMRNVVQIV
jgi:hypothetical protein